VGPRRPHNHGNKIIGGWILVLNNIVTSRGKIKFTSPLLLNQLD